MKWMEVVKESWYKMTDIYKVVKRTGFTKKAFYDWLRYNYKTNPSKLVGTKTKCPIHKCMREWLGWNDIEDVCKGFSMMSFGKNRMFVYFTRDRRMVLAPWAEFFINEIDKLALLKDNGRVDWSNITAETALKVLKDSSPRIGK